MDRLREKDVWVSEGALAGMALTAFGMALTPGPNMMYLVSRSISQGRQAGVISLVGTGVGFVVYMTMANLGLAAVFVAVPWLYVGFKAVGTAYLGYLAWTALRPGGAGVFETRELRCDSNWRLIRMGLLTNLLNPKAAILYLALIPQFVNPHAGHAALQGFVLGSVQISISLSVNALFILTAGGIARLMVSRPGWTKLQRRITGTLLATVTALLLKEVPARARV
ncbi:MAG TPA: LysE family translocator [Jatrophihabitantaceae bacterium]|nr:LysE family translocator [Jatrophihabitantaceae bacterium]